jgi:hypothetical protein
MAHFRQANPDHKAVSFALVGDLPPLYGARP